MIVCLLCIRTKVPQASSYNIMKIVHTIASLQADHGGPPRTVSALCTSLAEKSLDIEVITHVQDADRERLVLSEHNSVRSHLLPMQSNFHAFLPARSTFARTLAQCVTETPQIVVHDHGVWLATNHAVVCKAKQQGWPVVVSPRGMLASWSFKNHRWKKALAWRLYQKRDLRKIQVFHATSAGEANDVRSLGFRQPIAVIPNGVNVPDNYKRIPNGGMQRNALFMSRIHPKKGLINLVRAWAQIRPVGWTLIIAGPDENGHQAEIKREVQANDLTEAVTFAGPIKDVEKWSIYRRADIFILPTFSENFGVVVAEALASGLPVVTTKAAPWQEIETYGCGWWIDAGVESLAKAIKEGTELPDEVRLAMGRRGRALIEREYTWAPVAEQMRAVYEWMLGCGTKPTCVLHG